MKDQKGITLISLVMTIILIMILASVGTYTGLETYENMRVEAFVAKMKTVQEAVDKFCDTYTVSEIIDETNHFGVPASSAPSDAQAVLNSVTKEGMSSSLKSWFSSAGDDSAINYRYFSTDDIAKILGIKDFDTAIFFNPKTRNVVAVEGVKYDGKMYYRQYDLTGGQTLTTPNPDTNFNFTLNVTVKTFDDKAVIYATLGSTDSDKTITELKYKKKTSTTSYDEPIISKSLSEISITESGTYKVIAKTTSTMGYGEITKESDDLNITIVNKPLLVEGMTPVTMTGVGTYTPITDTQRVNKEDAYRSWYNYSENTTYGKRWANAKLTDGSIYVWLPRYAYSISGSTINIEFMKGSSSVITTTGKTLGKTYNVMPAFEDGSTTGYINGEWDSEITGIWVAKYETTENSSKPKNAYVDVVSWRGIAPLDAFKACRNMELGDTYFSSSVAKPTGTLSYGVFSTDTNNIDTHLMKNSEYAAVSYLTYSSYGNTSITALDNTSNKANVANEANSTTGNKYGIFGLIGSSKDIVAAGHDIATASLNSENKSTKYATYYSATQTSDSTILGDGIKETNSLHSSTKTYGSVLFSRGGLNSAGGIFAYDNKDASAASDTSFRPVLIVEY